MRQSNDDSVSAADFSGELQDGERVEWAGRPDTSILFHREDWLAIPFSLLWGGFSIFWLLGASGLADFLSTRPDRPFSWLGLIWGIPFVLAGQYFIWGRFLYNRWRKGRTYYALTNRRAIVLRIGLFGKSCVSVHLEGCSMLDKHARRDGKGAVAFGGPYVGEWQWGQSNPQRPLTFDDLPNANSVYQTALGLCEKQRRSDPAGST
ncbi:MAG: hypothetical protein FJW30_05770 [Acidobacteria bacterium]|nr:hypothetical protein [Acidobacteriota bacterium]